MSSAQDPHYQAFLRRLKAARRKAGMTQVEVAKRLGRPQSFVSKCESGERRVDVLELAEFAGLYRVPVDYFVKSAPAGFKRSSPT
ncbi:MAG: helix-turn-helix transcriptional regulator [Candidatus Eisenbacteria bacterium]|nr:helix-turn-helix transcriptional regulator [Candidatus Eisenbacteria bacterium]